MSFVVYVEGAPDNLALTEIGDVETYLLSYLNDEFNEQAHAERDRPLTMADLWRGFADLYTALARLDAGEPKVGFVFDHETITVNNIKE